MISRKSFLALVCVALLVAGAVILLGAYTRLTNAGLGCPDWPGCYGQLVLPHSQSGLQQAQSAYPQVPIVTTRAWTEMIHRYGALTLVILIVSLVVTTYQRRREPNQPWLLSGFLLLLIACQAALGMFTVTLKLLPIVVMGHLLGGVLTCATLWLLQLQVNPLAQVRLPDNAWHYKPWALLAVLIVFMQIALGGWVSSNYAGLACIGFPACNGQLLPTLHFAEGFRFFSTIGSNYQGGQLASTARITIQYVHRMGALVTASYLVILSLMVLIRVNQRTVQSVAVAVLGLVCMQFTLGVINVTHLLPLPIAVAHNGVAVLLLLAVVTLCYVFFQKETRSA